MRKVITLEEYAKERGVDLEQALDLLRGEDCEDELVGTDDGSVGVLVDEEEGE